MRDAALAFRMATNLARQACPVLMEYNQHAALTAWVQGCVEASSATDAGDMQAVADIVVTMATHPFLRMTGDRVRATVTRGVMTNIVHAINSTEARDRFGSRALL
jgi:hypothetical protein